MNKKNSIKHKIVTSKYFELSGLLLLIIPALCRRKAEISLQ